MGRRARILVPPLAERFELNLGSPQSIGLMAWYPTVPLNDAILWEDDASGRFALALASGTAKPTWQADPQMGGALKFASASSQFASETIAAPVTTTPLTLSCWYQPTTLVSCSIISITDSGAAVNNIELRGVNTGTFTGTYIGGSGTISSRTSTGTISTGVWSHLCVRLKSFDPTGAAWDCFLNGLLSNGSATQTGTPATPTGLNQLHVGHRGNSTSYCNGLIADVRVYASWLPDAVIWQMWDPLTRYDLYRPVKQRRYSVPAAGAVLFRRSLLAGAGAGRRPGPSAPRGI